MHARADGGRRLGGHGRAAGLDRRAGNDARTRRRARLYAGHRLALRHRHGRLERDRMSTTHHLDHEQIHREWNNSLPPRLTIDPGDTVVFDTRDAANRFYTKDSTHEDVIRRGPFRGHPLTGPVAVRGARPGDTLVVHIVDVQPALDWGWTSIRPGRGLLPESDFAKPFLQIWDLGDKQHARLGNRVAVPLAPFPGVMGVALDEPGEHSTMPPRRAGGNMDIKQLVAGATLYLPVLVDCAAGRKLCAEDIVAFGTVAPFVAGLDVVGREQWRNVWPVIRDFTIDVDDARGAVVGDRGWGGATRGSRG